MPRSRIKKKTRCVKIDIISQMSDLLMAGLLEAEEDEDDYPDDDNGDYYENSGSALSGATDNIEFSTFGTLSDDGGRIEISYEESALMGMTGAVTTLLYDKAMPHLIMLVRGGAYKTSLVFDAEKKRQHCIYDTGIAPPLDLCVFTRSIDNNLTYDSGGMLALDYIIEMRGVKTERNRFTMKISPRSNAANNKPPPPAQGEHS